MPFESTLIVAAVLCMFGAFGIAVAYVNMIAKDKAITFEQERARRRG